MDEVYKMHKLEKPYEVPPPEDAQPVSILEVREALADYMASEGCSCCENIEEHKAARERLAKLLDVSAHPKQDDFFDFSPFKSNKKG